jgi:putative addiction module component (TIGR02574 family)
MTNTALKRKISNALSAINDPGFLNALHTIVQSKKEEVQVSLTVAQKKELDKRIENHLSGKSKSYSWASVKKAALKK